jgi:hypothetical protein
LTAKIELQIEKGQSKLLSPYAKRVVTSLVVFLDHRFRVGWLRRSGLIKPPFENHVRRMLVSGISLSTHFFSHGRLTC